MSDRVTTKAVLLEHIHAARTEMAQFLDSLTEADLIAVADAAGWTIKDHVAHLTAWELSVVAFLRREPRHAALGVTRALYLSDDYDAINAVIIARERNRPVSPKLPLFKRSHA